MLVVVIIVASVISIGMVSIAVFLILSRRRRDRTHEPMPDVSVDTNPLMGSEPHSLKELCEWSQSGSGSGK